MRKSSMVRTVLLAAAAIYTPFAVGGCEAGDRARGETPQESAPRATAEPVPEAGPEAEAARVSSSKDTEDSDFLRFVETGDDAGRLETAVADYRRPDGSVVTLVGAVHIADPSYYDEIERISEKYDAFLYEMVKPDGADPAQAGESGSAVSAFQRFLKDVLELEFQLDGIDYGRGNFVHADLDVESFLRMQEERGESVFTLLLRAMLEQFRREAAGDGSGMTGWHLLGALMSPDRARALKLLFAREFDDMEALVSGIEPKTGEGSVLVSARNARAIEVVERELSLGKRRLALFYGAAHMPDLERRLRALGFEQTSIRWLSAWTVGAGPESKGGDEAPE